MQSTAKTNKDVLDVEWIQLMVAARNMGLTIEEVQNYLRMPSCRYKRHIQTTEEWTPLTNTKKIR